MLFFRNWKFRFKKYWWKRL